MGIRIKEFLKSSLVSHSNSVSQKDICSDDSKSAILCSTDSEFTVCFPWSGEGENDRGGWGLQFSQRGRSDGVQLGVLHRKVPLKT